ncbi:MAG: glycosyltransferase family 1 protein [Propionibacteriaceae bacterium]|jgi:hypothetical protein|nr:glycosyltransferase family 1 protein [Propionibacteriaceae bacterium]
MRVAIHYKGLQVDAEGHVAGHDAGDTLVRRLVRLFPGSQLIGPRAQSYPDFDLVTLEGIDGENTVVINMDVIESVRLWRVLRKTTEQPKIMNFMWRDARRYESEVEIAALSLSCALFPTFANSERMSLAIADTVRRWVVRPLAERAQISGANLGIRLDHVQPRNEPETPVVLYPAIYMSPRKRPEMFFEIVSQVARRTPLMVEARLAEQEMVTEASMDLGRQRWATVRPLVPSRQEYWAALAHTTAFVATASEESYGLEYVEALVAGAIGIFPDLPWAHAIVPPDYPFFYDTVDDAEEMLYRALTSTASCREQLAACGDGDFAGWLRDHHDDSNFEAAIADHVIRWFGPVKVSGSKAI